MNPVQQRLNDYFKETPLAELFNVYSNTLTVLFTEQVLNKISVEEYKNVYDWSGCDDETVKRISKDYDYIPNMAYIELNLCAIIEAVLLKKEFQRRYPNCTIEYSQTCHPFDTTSQPTRKWVDVIDQFGKIHDGRTFDVAQNGDPIDPAKLIKGEAQLRRNA